jgi:ABC-type sugar transport system permease subunit
MATNAIAPQAIARPRSQGIGISEGRLPLVMLFPAIVIMLFAIGIPMLYSLYLSFTDYSLTSLTHKVIGLKTTSNCSSTTRCSGQLSGARCCS